MGGSLWLLPVAHVHFAGLLSGRGGMSMGVRVRPLSLCKNMVDMGVLCGVGILQQRENRPQTHGPAEQDGSLRISWSTSSWETEAQTREATCPGLQEP